MLFDKPAAINGSALRDELRAAGFVVPDDGVRDLGDGTVAILTTGDESAVRAVIDAHVPPAPGPDPAVEFRAAVEKATTIAQLKAAILSYGSARPT